MTWWRCCRAPTSPPAAYWSRMRRPGPRSTGPAAAALRLRARWAVEKTPDGTVIVVSEIPWQVQKAKLIERLAELLAERKLPFLADVRDESTDWYAWC